MSNRLANETSPYLLQHKENPVDWYPWGADALALAHERDVPMLVSVGYSACHWCHVMAHESFENPAIAAYMNANFVNIKVDREERPDIDSICMSAVQAMSGQGGWPLNAFLTPDGVPFYGGTYWPNADRAGLPGFLRVLEAIHTAWTNNRDGILESASRVRAFLTSTSEATPEAGALTEEIASEALRITASRFDREYGGFGGAPKFPQVSVLEFLLRHYRRTGSDTALAMALTTLDRMAEGGINDQIGGGFARYAVDRIWLVPHFEKMLYDNAQLMSIYLDAWRITGNARYRDVVVAIAGWLRREMTSPEGGFYSSLDADSEGQEGKFYVWSEDEIEQALAPSFTADEIDLVKLHYGVTSSGNFEGSTILAVVRPISELAGQTGEDAGTVAATIERARDVLRHVREERERPGRDEKIVTAWNGLMVKALATAGGAFADVALVTTARKAATFLLAHLRHPDGSLARTWRDGVLRGQGTLDDHVFLAEGLQALYAVTGEIAWLDAAGELLDRVVASFAHPSGIGFFDTADDHEALVARPRDLQDGATPSGNASACDLLIAFGMMRDDNRLLDLAERTLASMTAPMSDHPVFMGRYLAVLERWLSPRRELVLAGASASESVAALRNAFLHRYEPHVLLGYATDRSDSRYPLLADRPIVGDGTAYLCERFTCLPPIATAADLLRILDEPVDTKA